MHMMMARRVIIFGSEVESLILALPCCLSLWFSPVPRHQPHFAQRGQDPAFNCGGAESRTPVVVNFRYRHALHSPQASNPLSPAPTATPGSCKTCTSAQK